MFKRIELTQGKIVIVDAIDYEWLIQRVWHVGDDDYARTRLHNAEWAKGLPRKIAMHRMMLNPPPGFEVDHINNNRLDNRRSNLRLVTRSQNICNSPNRPNKWGMRGVAHHIKSNTWQARITVQGKTHQLGYYKTPELAHAAYKEAVKLYHGDYAWAKR